MDTLTIHDYHGVMKTVGTADLKAHLSEHLKSVRSGETIVVTDRNTPIARIVPLGAVGGELVIRPARGDLHEIPLLGPLSQASDIMEQLLEERAERL